jgi:hypothetical protein
VLSFISLTEKIKESKPLDVHGMKADWGSKSKASIILKLGQWASSRTGRLTPGK